METRSTSAQVHDICLHYLTNSLPNLVETIVNGVIKIFDIFISFRCHGNSTFSPAVARKIQTIYCFLTGDKIN